MPRVITALTIVFLLALSRGGHGADWLQFRGPESGGVAVGERLPRTWSAEHNLAWKSSLPGRGLSSPIVLGKNVVVTASSGVRQDRLHVLCFDRDSGRQRWKRQFWATGLTFCHPKTSVAAPTPASDGERIFAFYSSNDVLCFDLDGNLLWTRGLTYDYPNSSNSVGMTSSPIVVGRTLVVQVENETNSFAVGLDTVTGANRWKISRPRKPNWTSPVAIAPSDGGARIVVLQSPFYTTGHHAESGKELWKYEVDCASIPSATVSDNRLYLPSQGLTALEIGAENEPPRVVWQTKKIKLGTSSPIVYEDHVYVVKGSILTCAETKKGEVVWKARLQGAFSGTPIVANGFLYAFNEDGLGQVVDLNGEGKVVAENALGERFLCTPAASQNGLYVRSDNNLFKIMASAD